jgi:hypothetical protein
MRTSRRYRRATTMHEGEDVYAFTSRTMRQMPFRDFPAHMMMRSKDRSQVEAMQLYAQLKMIQWTRALAWGTVFLGGCTIIAAFIVR